MFGRKRGSKGAKAQKTKKNAKAKKAVKRLLEKPGPDRMAEIANLAALENLQPFTVRASRDPLSFFFVFCYIFRFWFDFFA